MNQAEPAILLGAKAKSHPIPLVVYNFISCVCEKLININGKLLCGLVCGPYNSIRSQG